MMAARFRLRAVSKTYWGRRHGRRQPVTALAAVDFDIGDGQVTALMGRSGAGKTTLARIVMGFEAPDRGEVLFRERPLPEAPRALFRRCNQMVFQNPYLAVNPAFSVGQIISEPLRTLKAAPPRPDAVLDKRSAGGVMERVREAMEWLELPAGHLSRLPHELSGGELQRVTLARALVLGPEFLVLDEPFSALDDLTAMRILRQLSEILGRLRLGALFISHQQRHVHALADRVAVLEKGRMISGR